MRTGSCFLIAALDYSGDDSDGFDRWYVEEHIPERLACPGFVSAARLRNESDSPGYITIYEISSPAALQTEEYLALKVSPSARTTEMLGNSRVSIRQVYTVTDALTSS